MTEKSTSQEIAENLKRLEIFKTLPDETISGLVDHVEIIKLKPDQSLFKQGDPGDAVYIIRDGQVKIVGTEKDGREIVFNQQGAGAVIGEMALIDNEPRSAGVVALDELVGSRSVCGFRVLCEKCDGGVVRYDVYFVPSYGASKGPVGLRSRSEGSRGRSPGCGSTCDSL